MSEIFNKFVANYLLKNDNFKKVYNLMVERAIPNSIKNTSYKTDHGLETNAGLSLNNTKSDAETFAREIKIYNKQTLQNYIECIHEMYKFQEKHNIRWNEYTVLDVGVRSGVGSNLLGMLFCDTVWGYCTKFTVDALDIDDSWATYIKLLPYVNNYLPKNLYDIKDGSYDICFCSHTIEHLEDPITFVRKLTDIASEFAACYCPFDEKNISPRSGHRVIDDKIIAQINPIYTKLIKSINRKSEDLYYIFFITSNKYGASD